jgi:hypothetical protein
MDELLGALGLAWPRLLIYPGGLCAFALAWLLARWMQAAGGRRRCPTLKRRRILAASSLSRSRRDPGGEGLREVAQALLALVALSVLPLPPARGFPYDINLVVALALLGWPHLRTLMAGGLAEVIPGYGLLLLGAALMGVGAGGGQLSQLARAPEAAAGWAPLLGGAGLWLAGQARLYAGDRGWAARLGDLGHLWVGALPILAALGTLAVDRLPAGWAAWALPPLALIAAALVLGAALRIP